jgi:integrase
VYVPFPPFVIERLKRVKLRMGAYYFTGPESNKAQTAADLWRRKINRATKAAGIANGNPHRFRHRADSPVMPTVFKGVCLRAVWR